MSACPYWTGFTPQCTRNCRGFQCRHREEEERATQRQKPPVKPERCPWDEFKPARDVA